MGFIGLAPDPVVGRWRVFKGFLLTAGISLAVFGACFGIFALSASFNLENDAVGFILYFTVFYLAPLGFVIGLIGSIIAGIRYAMTRRARGQA